MLDTIKQLMVRGMSTLAAIMMFVIMLPVTIGLMLIMLVTGAAAVATLRHRLRKAGVNVGWQNESSGSGSQSAESFEKPPIEGSYTVIQK